MIDVKRHPRKIRVYGTAWERRKLRRGLNLLNRLGAGPVIKDLCSVKALDEVSHLMPPYRRTACSTANIGREDLTDTVETAIAVYHEALHAKDIIGNGSGAITRENEIRAHKQTRAFIEKWLRREDRPGIKTRLKQEMAEEDQYIDILKKGGSVDA